MINDSSRILAIETSGRIGSIAVGTVQGVVASTRLAGEMKHATDLLPAVEKILKSQGWPADSITDVFVSIGPGSFTGLRIGVSIARTLAWSIGSRVVAVPTLDALARNALIAQPVPAHVAVILDAKRSQVYAAAYSLSGTCPPVIEATLEEPARFLARCPSSTAVLGEGIRYHRAAVDASGLSVLDPELWVPRAENVFAMGLERAQAGLFTPSGELLPLYIRRPEAEEKWELLHPSRSNE
jgi:tRNA threonylcarbamoyladenosine biosynthesis protein TsaB